MNNIFFRNKGGQIDLAARRALWRSGMDYGHGTGHGIGYFLSVHESPASIGMGSRRETDEPLDIGMVESDGSLKA
jgi:Xaa-Pro aminopeptidase